MGLIDNKLIYSDAQDVTADADSTNHIDHGVARDLGAGQELFLLLTFGTVVSNAALVVSLVGNADDTNLGTAGTGGTDDLVILTTPSITPTSNTQYAIPIPSHSPRQYTKLYFDITGGSSPHIPVTATLVPGRELRVTHSY
jgi:hypothetical protein